MLERNRPPPSQSTSETKSLATLKPFIKLKVSHTLSWSENISHNVYLKSIYCVILYLVLLILVSVTEHRQALGQMMIANIVDV